MENNWIDLGFALVLALFVVRGLLRGMVQEVAGLLGLVLGFFVAGRHFHQVAPYFRPYIADPDWAAIAAYVALFVAAIVAVAVAAALVRKFMNLTFTSWLDHVLGGAVGGAKGFLICAIGLALLAKTAPDSPLLKKSLLAPYIDQATVFARSLLPAFL